MTLLQARSELELAFNLENGFVKAGDGARLVISFYDETYDGGAAFTFPRDSNGDIDGD